jgi:hypothetical protein
MLLVKMLAQEVQLMSKIEKASGSNVGYKRMCAVSKIDSSTTFRSAGNIQDSSRSSPTDLIANN